MDTGRMTGFTLIEMMVTLAVAVILMSIAAPSMQDLIASQAVRAAASELMTDFSYARADAVSNRRQVAILRLDQANDAWAKGWRLVACLQTPACAACADPTTADPACLEEPRHHPALGGRIKLCTRMNNNPVDTPALIFNPDGRVMDTAGGANLHINTMMVSDDMGNPAGSNKKLRALELGPTGRIALYEVPAAAGTACP